MTCLGLIEGKLARASLVQLAKALGIAINAMIRLGYSPRSEAAMIAFDLGGLPVEAWDQLGIILRAAHERTATRPE